MLSDSEIRVLTILREKGNTLHLNEISSISGIPLEGLQSISELLNSKGLVRVEEVTEELVSLTEEGNKRLVEGLPEVRLIGLGEIDIKRAKELMGQDFEIGLSWAKRNGWVSISNSKLIPNVDPESANNYPLSKALKKVAEGGRPDEDSLKILVSRGLIRRDRRKMRTLTITKSGMEALREVEGKKIVGNLTHDLLVNRGKDNIILREKNVETFPPTFPIARRHYFRQFLEDLKDILRSLGFTEITSGYVEMEFYNFDMLFQAQDHPAREIHDSFSIEGEGKLPDPEIVAGVRDVHERFWKYRWDDRIAKRLMLRSQTTASTARALSQRPPSGSRFFTLGRVFRPDDLDATHLLEFNQLDGLIVDDLFNFRMLLGTLREIFSSIGIKDVKFKPAYFPFTEPSVEIYGFMEGLGWVEMAGAGMLREEVTGPAGVNSPAGAWGMGIDRMAMSRFGIKDIRELYSNKVEFLRWLKQQR